MKLTTNLISNLSFLAAVGTLHISAATLEIDPATSIPATHDLVYEVNWDTDGDTEGWAANGQVTLDAGTPLSGKISGTNTGGDPNINVGGLSVTSSPTTIIEFALTRPVTDTSAAQIFYGDDRGGISGVRTLTTGALTPTGGQQVYRFTAENDFVGDLTQFRFDISTTDGATFSVDYFRVYSVVPVDPIDWDPTQSGGTALGGDGTWDTTLTNFWDGAAQVAWPTPSTGKESASFGGAGGAVTIDAGGIVANAVQAVSGYTFTGGSLSFDGNFPSLQGTDTVFDIPVINTSTDTLNVNGNNGTFSQTSTNTGDFAINMGAINIGADDAFGTGTVSTKNGANVFLGAVDSDKTLSNNFEFTGNRLVINRTLVGGLAGTAADLIVDGNFNFAGTSPSDIFLRNNLTINGVVSGSSSGNNAIWFQGDAGVMTLNNDNNTFGGTGKTSIRFNTSTLLEVNSDGSLGDPANLLRFSGGQGGVFFKNDASFTRDIVLEGSTRGEIGTDGILTIEEVAGTSTEVQTPNATGTPILGTFGTGTVNFNLAGLDLGRARLAANSDFTNINAPILGGLEAEFGLVTINADFTNNLNGAADPRWRVLNSAVIDHENGALSSSFLAQVGVDSSAPEMAIWNANGGTFQNNGEFLIGWTGPGTLNINAGASLDLNFLRANNGDDGAETEGVSNNGQSLINFNGGTTAARRISGQGNAETGESFGIWTFNGGTIQAKANPISPFIYNLGSALVSDGGVIINSNGEDVEARVDFTSDPGVTGADGGLTKLGEGTLLLTGANTYTGPTSADAGCLVISSAAGIPSPTTTFVANGAAFGGQVGTGGLTDSDLQNLIDNANWTAGSSLIIDTNGEDVTVAANITGDIGLIKKGEGELTLTGTNTYTGETEVQGGSIAGFNPNILIDSIARAGNDFTINFTASGNVDVFRSTDLLNWGSAIATDQTSPFTDNAATEAKFFYVLVPTGETFPPAP